MSEKDIVGPDGPKGIDPQLLPYLEEADREDPLQLTDISGDGEADADQMAQALHNLMEGSLLAGPDPQVLVEQENAPEAPREHLTMLAQAAAEAEALRQVDEIYQQIIARAPEHQVQPSLERIQTALSYMGDPQQAYPTIHIAGTNGKTSTSRMCEALCRAWGMHTGLFTSPHLVDVRERICLDGQPIAAEKFIEAWEENRAIIDLVDQASLEKGGPKMSFFEVFTALAFAAFADAPVDMGVIEVGMGGLWDCTNVLLPGVQVITPISIDHQKWLGYTKEEIAAQKAGIIKPDSLVVIGKQDPQVLEVLLDKVRKENALARVLGQDFEVLSTQQAVGGQLLSIRTPAAVYEDIYLPLFGYHQAENAACALAAFEAVLGGKAVPANVVEEGFSLVTSPGRLEVVRSSPTILVDAAHNPGGAETLRAAVEQNFPFKHIVGIYSAMADKDIEGTLSQVEPLFDELVVVPMDSPRAADLETLTQIAQDVFGEERVHPADSLLEGVAQAVDLSEGFADDPLVSAGVVIFGSVVLAGQARQNLLKS